MSRSNSAPTLGWLATGHITKWVTIVFIFIIMILTAITIREAALVDADCSHDREIHAGKYTVYITTVSDKCEPK